MRYAVILTLAAALLAPASALAAKPATFSGSIGGKLPRGATSEVRAIDRATGAVAAVDGVSRSGAFAVRVPAGAYTVVATVVPRGGGAPRQVVSGVTLKPGQRRARANLKRKRKRKKARGRVAYTQERGQVTPGVIAIEIPDVTGDLRGDLGAMSRGINDLAMADMFGVAEPDCDIAVLEVDRRADIEKELAFQQSPYVDPSTRVERNFVLGDVEVVGRATQRGADRADVEYRLRDKRTGADLGSVKGSVGGDAVFEQLERLSRKLSEELCKLSDTYDVTLDVQGTGNFATHAASGSLRTTLSARRANRKANVWTQTGPLAWANVAFSSKSECPYLNPVVPTVAWNVTLRVAGEQLQVTWGLAGNDMTTATVDCPPSGPDDPDPPPIPGQPGTSLLSTGPGSFTLPFAGGTQPISGGVSDGADGWFNAGTMVVKPGPIVRVSD